MVGLAAIIAGFFEVWFYLACGLAKQLFGIGSPVNLRLGFKLIVALGLGMRTLAWNCRGAGRAPTVRALKAFIREESPDVVFIAESKSKSRRIEKIFSSIGFVDKFCVDPAGKSRGLAIFWEAGVDLESVYSDKNVIASLVYFDPPSSLWLFLLIYGPPHINGRARFWKCLEDLVSAFVGPWLVMGDFNCVDSNLDKRGGRYLGEAGVKHLATPTSDHAPVILDTHMDQSARARLFRFEAMWTRDDSSSGIVEKAWQEVFLFSIPNVPPNLDGLIEPCIATQENDMLITVPSADDIKRVVFEMHPFKASGLQLDAHQEHNFQGIIGIYGKLP
nr:hypothetical protein CFP56_43297 [Quercus suber]